VAVVRKRTIPTERSPLVGEVSANFWGVEGAASSAQWIPTAVNLGFLDRSRYIFIQVAPQLSSRGWVNPVPDPLLLRKSGRAENRTRDLWICSQKLWPLDHRGGLFRYTAVRISTLLNKELKLQSLVWMGVKLGLSPQGNPQIKRLELSRRCLWKRLPSETWLRAVWYSITSVLKERDASTFWDVTPCSLVDCWFYRVLTMVYNTQNYWVFGRNHRPDSK
jgi:hypothetical protein